MEPDTVELDAVRDFDLDALLIADDVDRWAKRIFGSTPSLHGTLQVMAVWRGPGGTLETLSDDAAPRCLEDAFALGMARARADAILTTGAVLRQESELRHQPGRGAPFAAALEDWRAASGKRRPATTVILTKSRDLDLDHPLLRGGQVIVFTGADAPTSFGVDLARRGAMLMTATEPTPRGCLARLAQAGFSAVSIESGPRVASGLLGEPLAVDELLLTTFLAPSLDEHLRRGVLINEDGLAKRLRAVGDGYRTHSADGPWLLRRFVR